MPIIELREVSKLYGFGDATTLALDEVNLSIEQGEFVGIMGPSGCGKSTLMNIIGLLDNPTRGTFMFNGRAAAKLRPNQRAKIRRDKIGFIFQSFNLIPRMTVLENVALPLVYKGTPYVKRLKIASAMLDRVGLKDREYYLPRHLSGGQAQTATIARALINNPPIIIADEPTGNLDSSGSRLILELLSEIHKTGTTVLLVTHNPEITRYATRVVYMHDGLIIHDEKTSIGDVAPLAQKVMYSVPATTEEDDFAGVSTLMKAFPAIASDSGYPKSAKKSKARKNRAKTKKKRKVKT